MSPDRVARRTYTPTDNTTVHPPTAPAGAAAAAADNGQPAATEDADTSELAVWRQTSTPRLDEASQPAVVATPSTAQHANRQQAAAAASASATNQPANQPRLTCSWVCPRFTLLTSSHQAGESNCIPHTGLQERSGHRKRGLVLYGGDAPISGQPDSRGNNRPYKEKKTLPGTLVDVSEFVCVTAPDGAAPVERTNDRPTPPISVSRVGNVNPIPFRSGGLPTNYTTPMRARTYALMQGTPRLCAESPNHLGPPDPWPTAVPIEPFSTSALKILT
ncbi:rRNA promoter binding protein [Echinococcus multilocularis]|uniref:rRNA promoter binding protein n=1 Tax=Echinococcus multilocularis TaxID=6211 RepID=A0A0S4MM97_ECHMU|nr:rRNA promoter binding protein [Echinococcus multilocularis]